MSAEALLAIAVASCVAVVAKVWPPAGPARPQSPATRPARRRAERRGLRSCDHLAEAWHASEPERR